MKTLQEVFDLVSVHLIRQGQVSRSDEQSCAYRGANGLSCAVGCLIPEGADTAAYEGQSVHNLLTPGYDDGGLPELRAALIEADVFDVHMARGHQPSESMKNLLSELQSVHDCFLSLSGERLRWRWAMDLRELGQSYRLSTAALDAAYEEFSSKALVGEANENNIPE